MIYGVPSRENPGFGVGVDGLRVMIEGKEETLRYTRLYIDS